MTSDRWNQIRAALDEVSGCDPESRDAVLRERFAGDGDLRRVIETLLTAGADASPREISATQATTIATSSTISLAFDDEYGPYVPLRKLGEGGMGTVYLARQEEPILREVALKVVKLGMDSRQVLARFEIERRTLALIEHPHVARVLDAGTSVRGRPYFVMEFVNGVPIDRYCDRNTLGIRDRLNLFLPVCAAIQYAHQKGIIHRDIKPSNILIAEIDGSPVPKVIDFGIARATDARVAECDAFTVAGQIIGTPEYMSPEQANLGALDIDTTTDVYSLGVVLYELLVGVLPRDRGNFRNVPFSEVVHTIREAPIPRPRNRITDLGPAAVEVARKRSSDPERLKRELSGDLEWVLMKAMERERERRYASVSEFAADIERTLKNEPVAAGPPGAAYRIRKFVSRHRLGIATAAAFVLFLIAAVVVSATQAIRANRERERAVAAGREAEAEKLAAYAMGNLSEDPERSAILSLYALQATLPFHLGVRPSAENALHRAMLSLRSRVTFRGHRNSVVTVTFSPDGAHLLTASLDGTAKIWDVGAGAEVATLSSGGERLSDAVFSPDGTRIATADESGVVKLWDVATGGVMLTLRHGGQVSNLLYGAENRVAVLSVHRTLTIWDLQSGRELFTQQGQVSASFSPDGRRILTVGADRSAAVWDVSGGRKLFTLRSEPISQAAYSPDGAFFATGSPDGPVKLWNAAKGTQTTALEGCAGAASVFFSPDGRRVGAAGIDHKSLFVWNTATRKQISALRSRKSLLWKAVFSPDNEWISAIDLDQSARLWNASTGEEVSPFFYRSVQVRDLAFSLNGHWVATAEAGPTARLWDLRRPRELLYLEHPARSVAFSPDGHRIAIATSDKSAKIVDAGAGGLLLTLRGHDDALTSVAFSADGTRLVTGSMDGAARVWDAASGAGMLTLRGGQVVVWKAVFSPDGRQIATAGTDRTTRLWDASSGQELQCIRSGGRVMDVAFSLDGRLLATGGDQSAVDIWDTSSGRLLRRIDKGPKPAAFGANLIAFSPDGKRIVTASGNPVLWDIATGRDLRTLRGHTKIVTAVAFSPDGKRVATGSRDQSAAIWDAETGQQLFVFQHDAPITEVAFSHDGRRIAVADATGVQVYAVDVADLMRLARSRVTRPLTPAECRNFFQSDACPPLLP